MSVLLRTSIRNVHLHGTTKGKFDIEHFFRHPVLYFFPVPDTIRALSLRKDNCINTTKLRLFSTSVCRFDFAKKDDKNNAIVESKEGPYAGLTLGEKVKEAGKDATYTGVIIVGLGVLGVIAYAIGQELFSSSSPSGIYGYALKKCKQNPQVVDALGEPIKGYGETTRRGRRRHVSHMEYMEDGIKHLRMKFYVEGPHKKGTVTLECKENERGKYETRFIYVELDGYPSRVIVVEDNRHKQISI